VHNIYAATPDAAWSHFTSLLVPTFALRRDLLKASFERIAARVPLVEGKQNKKTKKDEGAVREVSGRSRLARVGSQGSLQGDGVLDNYMEYRIEDITRD